MRILLSVLVVVAFGFFSFSLANEIKTTETYIYDSDTAVSSQVNQSFSLYIGDDLSGVSTPVKSVHVAVSGVYTGNGTLELQLDSDPTTSQVFTLPNVGGHQHHLRFFMMIHQIKLAQRHRGHTITHSILSLLGLRYMG